MSERVSFKLPEKGLNGIAKVRHFEWNVDEPISDGGTDKAPTPMDYVFGGLASCIAITLRLYAERKEWKTGKIEVEVYKMINQNNEPEIHKKITFENQELTEEQLKRLYAISDKCPVSKLLAQPNSIVLDNQ